MFPLSALLAFDWHRRWRGQVSLMSALLDFGWRSRGKTHYQKFATPKRDRAVLTLFRKPSALFNTGMARGAFGLLNVFKEGSGYKLANDGIDTRTIQSYLGHKSIRHTVRYRARADS